MLLINSCFEKSVENALKKLVAAAGTKGVELIEGECFTGEACILSGISEDHVMRKYLKHFDIVPENRKEGVIIQSGQADGHHMILLSGTDVRGLVYAILELVKRVEAYGAEVLESAELHTVEYPAIENRIAGRFVYGERDDSWYFNDEFWDYYTDRLAEYRVNRLHLILGFDTAYMSPPYPFLIKTPGYEEVTAIVKGDVDETREKTLSQLKKIGQICHDKGIDYCLGLWQQKPWTDSQTLLVNNCPGDDVFTDYCAKSIKELIRLMPEIDMLSLRVNPEAGIRVKTGDFNTASEFWYVIFDAIREARPHMKVELRAKGLTDSMIDYAVNLGLDVTVPTKAMAEHIGLPYQMLKMREEELKNTGINENSYRRYSYDNLQRWPRQFELQYRLWNYGSTNILLWGDPYHASRFVKSCTAGQANGFEFTVPLTMKGGNSNIPGDEWPIHVHEDMITYKFEDERYWMWYLCFGRLGYAPDEDPEIWRREMRAHFGQAAASMEQAYLASGKILPLVTTQHFPEHPSLHWWPELYGSAALFAENNYEPYFWTPKSPQKKDNCYGNAYPCDEQLFTSIENYVKGQLSGNPIHAYSPLAVGDMYYALASQTMYAVNKMLEAGQGNREIKASLVDFTMVAHLGYYNAYMTQAAYRLCLFNETGDKAELMPCYMAMKAARDAYAVTAALGSKYYARDLEFDAGTSTKRNGNWEDRLHAQMDADLAKVKALLQENGVQVPASSEYTVGSDLMADACKADHPYQSLVPSGVQLLNCKDNVPEKWDAGKDLPITLKIGYAPLLAVGKMPILHYRRVNMRDDAFKTIEMEQVGEEFRAIIPGEDIDSTFSLYVYFSFEDMNGNIGIHPGIFNMYSAIPVYVVDTRK